MEMEHILWVNPNYKQMKWDLWGLKLDTENTQENEHRYYKWKIFYLKNKRKENRNK